MNNKTNYGCSIDSPFVTGKVFPCDSDGFYTTIADNEIFDFSDISTYDGFSELYLYIKSEDKHLVRIYHHNEGFSYFTVRVNEDGMGVVKSKIDKVQFMIPSGSKVRWEAFGN